MIPVDAKSNKSELYALSAIQKVAKKAIVERLKRKYKIETLSESGAAYHVEVNVAYDEVNNHNNICSFNNSISVNIT